MLRIFFTYFLLGTGVSAQTVVGFDEPFPFVGGAKNGSAVTAAPFSILHVGRNAAQLGRIDNWSLLFDHRMNESNQSILYGGGHFSLRPLSMAIGTTMASFDNNRDKQINQYNFSGMHLSSAYDRFLLPIGASLYYYKDAQNNRRTGLDAGVLYTIESDANQFFTLHRLNLGLRLRTQVTIDNAKFELKPAPAIAMQLLKYKWFAGHAFIDFNIEHDFVRVPTNYGMQFDFASNYFMGFGFSGEEFFSSENLHLGFGLRASLGSFSVRADTAHIKSDQVEIKNSRLQPNASLLFSYGKPALSDFSSSAFLADYYLNTSDRQARVEIGLEQLDWQNAIDYTFLITDQTNKTVFELHNKVHSRQRLENRPNNLFWQGQNLSDQRLPPSTYRGTLYVLKKNLKVFEYHIANIHLVKENPLGLIEISPRMYRLKQDLEPVSIKVKTAEQAVKKIVIQVKNLNNQVVFSSYCAPIAGQCTFSWWPNQQKTSGVFSVSALLSGNFDNVQRIRGPTVRVIQQSDQLAAFVTPTRLSQSSFRKRGVTVEWPAVKNTSTFIVEIRNPEGKTIFRRKQQGNSLKYRGQASHGLHSCLIFNEDNKLLGSSQFLIDAQGPLVGLRIKPVNDFVPSFQSFISMNMSASDESEIKNTVLQIKDRFGSLLWQRLYRGAPPPLVEWNGFSGGRIALDSDTEYRVELKAIDEFQNWSNTVKRSFKTGIIIKSENIKEITRNSVALGRMKRYRMQLPTILFRAGSDTPLPGVQQTLQKIVPILQKKTEFKIRIEGHIHRSGNRILKSQKILSEKRAAKVKEILAGIGIEPERMVIFGWGGEKPLSRSKTARAAARNRRVEIILIPAR